VAGRSTVSKDNEVTGAVGPDRRKFVKGLIAAGVFAAPVVSSFTMSGVESVFAAVPRNVSLGLNSNCGFMPSSAAPPGFSGLVDEFMFFFFGGTYEFDDGGVHIKLTISNFALPNCTIVSIYKVDPAAAAALVPAGQTPVNGYAVVWNSQGPNPTPNAGSPITMTVTNAPVVAGNPVYVFDKTTNAATQDTVATDGTWVVTFVVDPAYVVTQAAAAAATPTVVEPRFTG
jgi:hypothetical protein